MLTSLAHTLIIFMCVCVNQFSTHSYSKYMCVLTSSVHTLIIYIYINQFSLVRDWRKTRLRIEFVTCEKTSPNPLNLAQQGYLQEDIRAILPHKMCPA